MHGAFHAVGMEWVPCKMLTNPFQQSMTGLLRKLRPPKTKTRKLRPPYFLYFCPSVRHFSNLQPQLNSVRYGVYHLLSIPLVNFKVIAKKETNRKLRPEN